MILLKLSIIPEPLFKPIVFKNGINYIFGKKEIGPKGETGKSLNGIGKSMVLDLINFCLLAAFNKNSSKRLYAAFIKVPLNGLSIVLDFKINEEVFSITRSFDNPDSIQISHNNKSFVEYEIKEAKQFLCKLIFGRNEYEGILDSKWLRRLLPFYIKIQNLDKSPFINPIKYMTEAKEMEFIQYHFFLLNLDNRLPVRFFELNNELNSLNTLIRRARKALIEIYGARNKKLINASRNKLTVDIERLKSAINSFHLSEKYKIDKEAADKLTVEIKNLWFQIASDEQKVQSLQESLKVNNIIKVDSVTRIYEEMNELLGQQLKKTLEEAVEFRKSLISSRKEFIKKELKQIKEHIVNQNELLNELETNRATIIKILEEKEAFNDLRDAYNKLTSKQEELNQLENQNKFINDIETKQIELKQEILTIREEIKALKDLIKSKEIEFTGIVSDIYNNLYPQHSDSEIFEIVTNPTKRSLIKFKILENAEMHSHGKNQGRTLIYDLSVLFNSIQQNFEAPRFLIHDGIIDGIDKTHFIELVKYLEKKVAEGYKFQYFITLNEEGTLKESFADGDLVTPAKIAKEAVINLTPYKTLFGIDYI